MQTLTKLLNDSQSYVTCGRIACLGWSVHLVWCSLDDSVACSMELVNDGSRYQALYAVSISISSSRHVI